MLANHHIFDPLWNLKSGGHLILLPLGAEKMGGGGMGGKLPAPASFIPADMWSFSTHMNLEIVLIVYYIWKII